MAEVGVHSNAKIWLGDTDYSGFMNAVALVEQVNAKDNTKFGMTTESSAAGLKTIRTEASGLWDDTIDDNLVNNIGSTGQPLSLAFEGGQAGELAYIYQTLRAQYDVGGQVGELLPYTISATGRGGPLVRGTILHGAVAETVTSNGTAFQVGAIGSGQTLYAALHVFNASAGDTLDVTVQSDDASGFPSASNRITFPQATANGSQWLTLAGPLAGEDWWRAQWTIGGVSPSFTFALIIGIV